MTNFITIYLLIGLAHWAQHFIQCEECHGRLSDFVKLVLEGVVHTFGWPLEFVHYLRSFRKPQLTSADVETIKNQVKEALGAELLEIAQAPGESVEDFKHRAFSEMDKLALKARLQKVNTND